jgi:hypothetical protein
MRRRTRISDVLWLVVVLIGLPVGLLQVPGRPSLPRHLLTQQQLLQVATQPVTRGTMVAAAVGLGWIWWTVLSYTVAADLLRHVVARARRLPGPLQSLSAAVLGAVAVSSTTTGAAAHTAAHLGPVQTRTLPHPPRTLSTDTPTSCRARRSTLHGNRPDRRQRRRGRPAPWSGSATSTTPTPSTAWTRSGTSPRPGSATRTGGSRSTT